MRRTFVYLAVLAMIYQLKQAARRDVYTPSAINYESTS